MSRAGEALEQLRRANPLPDIAEVDADELALFLAHFEERRSSMATTDVRERPQGQTPAATRTWRPALAFGVALIALVVLVGGIVVLVGGGEEPDVAPPVPTTTVAPLTTQGPTTTAGDTTGSQSTTSVAPITAAPVGTHQWTRHDLEPEVMYPDVGVFGDPGWVALQQTADTSLRSWFSPDGVAWEQTQIDVADEGMCNPEIAYGQGFYLAIGDDCQVARGLPPTAVMLRSSDGKTWTRLPGDSSLSGLEVGPVVHGDHGFVMLGGDGDDGLGQYWVNVFHSADGETWTHIPHDDRVFGSEGWIDVRGVVYGTAGYVAIGADDLGGDGQVGVVWHSPDGRNWTRAPNVADMFGGPSGPSFWIELEAVAYSNGVYVIVGEGGAVPSIWISNDGRNWSAHADEAGVFEIADKASGVFGMAGGDSGFIVIGHVLELRPPFEGSDEMWWQPAGPAAWSSPDGLEWTREPEAEALLGGEVSFLEVAHGDGRFVIHGFERVQDSTDPEVYIEHKVIWTVE